MKGDGWTNQRKLWIPFWLWWPKMVDVSRVGDIVWTGLKVILAKQRSWRIIQRETYAKESWKAITEQWSWNAVLLSRFVLSCSHKGLTISVQELLSSTAIVQDSTSKFQVQMVPSNGPWSAVSDPQSQTPSPSSSARVYQVKMDYTVTVVKLPRF